jgi:hypothetical protein
MLQNVTKSLGLRQILWKNPSNGKCTYMELGTSEVSIGQVL